MADKFLNNTGLSYFYNRLKSVFVQQESGKGLSSNDYTTAEKTKLDGIATGAEVNQNAFSNISVGGSTISASSKTASVTLTAGNNVTLTPNTSTSAVTIASENTEYDIEIVENTGIPDVYWYHLVSDESGADTLMFTAYGVQSSDTEPNAFYNVSAVNSLISASGALPTQTTPLMDGTAAIGTENAYARGDHVHPSDTSKAPLASPNFSGTPTAPTANAGTNTTQIATTAFVKTAVDNAIAGITQFEVRVVSALPATGEAGVIYLVAHSHGTGDAYDEYIWTGSAFEKIGNTDIDLSNYWSQTDLVAITTAEIDALFA